MLQVIINIAVFLFTIGLIIVFHELGHFIAAKLCGVKVEEFALGFKPNLFYWQKGETKYLINLIPLGGYVKLLGEETDFDDPRSLNNQPSIKKIFILSSGVLMNFALAFLLFIIGYNIGMAPIINNYYGEEQFEIIPNYIVTNVEKNFLADKSDIRCGDIIIGLEFGKLLLNPNLYKNKEISFKIKRGNNIYAKKINFSNINNKLGLEITVINLIKLNLFASFQRSLKETPDTIILTTRAIIIFFKDLFCGKNISDEIAGPVKIYSITIKSYTLGISYLIRLLIVLTINIGVINILPIPALDGGRIFVIFINNIFRRKIIKFELENCIHFIGFMILIILMLIVTICDIKNL